MKENVRFGSRIGLIAATVGSAVGLGNVWRFPAVVQTNGGAAFLMIYIGCVFLLGIPVMLAEFSLGRGTHSDAVGAFRQLAPGKKWWITGFIAILASYLILSFYMVVAGWTFEYFWQSLTGALYEFSGQGGDENAAAFNARMGEYIAGSWRPLVVTFVVIVINMFILLRGVQKGIEKMSNILMPVLFVILVIFACVALTLPKAADGIAFFLNPDFSKITPGVVINALGQAFFSLSLGMGILITYSGYFPKDARLVKTAVTVSALDLMVALLMGFIIFPAVMSFSLDNESLEGAALVFVTMPEVFAQMPFTRVWSSLFFLLLFVAALTSTISLAEVSIAFLQDRFSMRRRKACIAMMVPLAVLSTICSLSQGVLDNFRIFGLNIFDLLDTVATNIMLPVAAIFTCIFIGWIVPEKYFRKELTNNGELRVKEFPVIRFIVRYAAPVLIAVILFAKFIGD